LREGVIDAVKRGEMSRRAAARRYEISESAAIKWLERVELDGSREPIGHGGHRASKLMPHWDFLEATPPRKSQQTERNLSDDLELWWLVSFDHWLSLKAREKKRPGQ
jgi:transposase